MRCTSPRTVGFQSDGKTLCWSPTKYNKQFATFQLPCGKCISCRLLQAREKSIRCVHEASLHTKNTFLTLTYSDEKLESQKLIYPHIQKFIRDIRYRYPEQPIPCVTTGEYGTKNKRPHWHLLLFNFAPHDMVPYKKNKQGDQLYTSPSIDEIWSYNNSKEHPSQIGPINLATAGYVCRYQLKKQEHKETQSEYSPIVRYSSKYAIGKKWLEKNWQQTFDLGFITIQGGEKQKIPRYYEKWLKKNQPQAYEKYIITIRNDIINNSSEINKIEEEQQKERNDQRLNQNWRKSLEISANKMRDSILKQKTDLIKSSI